VAYNWEIANGHMTLVYGPAHQLRV
jgi:hypothetical protein